MRILPTLLLVFASLITSARAGVIRGSVRVHALAKQTFALVLRNDDVSVDVVF